jgi:hypothetical protein
VIGPKTFPTPVVPRDWKRNNPMRMMTATGTTYGSKSGVAICNPSTALRTEIAGVIIPSA